MGLDFHGLFTSDVALFPHGIYMEKTQFPSKKKTKKTTTTTAKENHNNSNSWKYVFIIVHQKKKKKPRQGRAAAWVWHGLVLRGWIGLSCISVSSSSSLSLFLSFFPRFLLFLRFGSLIIFIFGLEIKSQKLDL